jgi:adenosylcobinamide-GDP ribazoletransferase
LRFLAAFRFLTVIPLPFGREATPEEIGGSLPYFPVVGLLIGLVLAGVYGLLSLLFPAPVALALVMVLAVLLNGALHLDGFIDTCDGLAGNKPVEERWRVMRDSRVGAFGVIGAALLVLGRYVSLANLPNGLVVAALVLMPVLGRWAMVWGIVAYPYARPSGLGTLFKQNASRRAFATGSVIVLAVAVAVAAVRRLPYFYLAAAAVVGGVFLVSALWTHFLSAKFAGLTGDSYGAINEIAEIGVLLVLNAMAFRGWMEL